MVESNSLETSNHRPELSVKPADRRPAIYGIIAAVVVIAFFIGIGWLFFSFFSRETTETLRDMVIIFLGLGSVLIILLLIALVVIAIYLVLKVNDLVKLLDREIKPILTNVQSTVKTAQGTAVFLSDQAAKPVIGAASTVAAVRAITRTLFRRN